MFRHTGEYFIDREGIAVASMLSLQTASVVIRPEGSDDVQGEVPLPLTRDYFEALAPTKPKSARSPLRASSRKLGSVGTGTMGTA